jgi:hypothetical protein
VREPSVAPAVSDDPLYGGMDPPDVPVVNQDAPRPTLAIDPAEVTEGTGPDQPLTFTVRLVPAGTQVVTVTWDVVDGTAQAATDLVVADAHGVLQFQPGETSKPLVIRVKGDRAPEPTETFTVRLSGATNAAIGVATAIGTIRDDDAVSCSPRPNVVVTTARVGPDRLRVWVKAGQGALTRLTFGSAGSPLRNAEVETTDPTGVIRGTGTLTPPPGTPEVSFTVRRPVAGQPVQVPLVVEDGCGPWPTFVGAGATAF